MNVNGLFHPVIHIVHFSQSTLVLHHLKFKVRKSNFYMMSKIRILLYRFFSTVIKMHNFYLAFRGRECLI